VNKAKLEPKKDRKAVRFSKVNSEEEKLAAGNPLAYGAGEAASYLTPGGSSALYGKAAKSAGNLIKGTGKLAKYGKMAAGAAAGFGSTGAAQELGNKWTEETPLEVLKAGGVQAGVGGLVGPASVAAAKGLGAAGKAIGKQAAPWLSGVPLQAIKDYVKGAKTPGFKENIKEIVGNEPAIAEKLAESVQSVCSSAIYIPISFQSSRALKTRRPKD